MVASFASAALLAGCGPSLDGLVVSTDDNAFTWSAGLPGSSGRADYEWTVSGEKAWVDWKTTSVEAGFFGLVIADASGEEIYRGQANPEGTPAAALTDTTEPGTWTLTVRWTDAEGKGELEVTGVRQ